MKGRISKKEKFKYPLTMIVSYSRLMEQERQDIVKMRLGERREWDQIAESFGMSVYKIKKIYTRSIEDLIDYLSVKHPVKWKRGNLSRRVE